MEFEKDFWGKSLNQWIGLRPGKTENMNSNGCFGRAYFGEFEN